VTSVTPRLVVLAETLLAPIAFHARHGYLPRALHLAALHLYDRNTRPRPPGAEAPMAPDQLGRRTDPT